MIVSSSIALLLVVAAAALRFYRLGHWSFALDEVATLSEVRALFDPTFAPSDSQIIVDSTREGLPSALQRWLLANTSHTLHVTRKRFDYFENTMDVFIFER